MASQYHDLESRMALPDKKSDDFERPAYLVNNTDEKQLSLPPFTPSSGCARLFHLLTSSWSARSFLPSWLDPSFRTPAKSPLPTLDGLRGICCVIVFNYHFVKNYSPDVHSHWIYHTPFLRFFWNGPSSVCCFFVISGYVLCYRPLKLIRKRDSAGLMKAMSSSFFRRGFRLYLPCLFVSFTMLWLTYFNVFARPAQIVQQFKEFTLVGTEDVPPQDKNLYQLFTLWWNNVKFLTGSTFPFDYGFDHYSKDLYDFHQWTIPVEMRGSLALFATVVAVSRMRTIWRLLFEMVLIYYLYNTWRIYVVMFFIGFFLCDLDLTRRDYYAKNPQRAPYPGTTVHSVLKALLHRSEAFYRTMYLSTFVLGWFLISSAKEDTPASWIWTQLDSRKWSSSPDEFLRISGGMFGVWAVANSPTLAPFFDSRFIQYLGHISFALYLMHGPVIRTIGYVWLPWSFHLGTATPLHVHLDKEWYATTSRFGVVMSNLFGLLVVGGFTTWAADVFWRKVDMRCVKFAREIENWVCEDFEE